MERHRDWLFAAHLGLAFGLLHLPLSLELAVTLRQRGSLVTSLMLFLLPVAMALTGVGAAMAHRRPRLARSLGPARVAGAGLLLFLLATLQLNFSMDSVPIPVAVAVHGLGLGCWFVALGMSLTGVLLRVRERAEAEVGRVWAMHLLGLVVGYLASEPIVRGVGPNAMILVAGLAILASPRWSAWLFPALLAVAVPLDLDHRLERARHIDADDIREQGEPIYTGWSRFGRVHALPDGQGRYRLYYNLSEQYTVRPFTVGGEAPLSAEGEKQNLELPSRTLLYGAVGPEMRVLLTGTGSGRGMRHLGFVPTRRITAVERDPAAAALFAEVRPDLNGGLYHQVDFRVADGRHVAETLAEPLDFISLESSIYQPVQSMLPVTAPQYLHTREALQGYLAQLKPDGLLAMEFARTRAFDSRMLAPLEVLESLEALGVPHRVLNNVDVDQVTIVAAHSDQALAAWVARSGVDRHPGIVASWQPEPPADWRDYDLTDDRPFVQWASLAPDRKATLLAVAAALLGVGVAIAAALWATARRARTWNPVPYAFAVGAGHSVLQFHAFMAWRSYFGDELLTIVRLIVFLLIYGAIGSWLSARPMVRRHVLPGAALLLALHGLGLWLIPFHEPSPLLREAYATVATLPGGLLLGALLPLGLARASTGRLALCLEADAVGTLVGFTLLYVVALLLGVTAYGALGFATVLVAAALLGSGRS